MLHATTPLFFCTHLPLTCSSNSALHRAARTHFQAVLRCTQPHPPPSAQVGWYSPFLLAVYDAETEEFQSIGRCMSGFSDVFYTQATARLGATVIPGPKPYYRTAESPSVWCAAPAVGHVLLQCIGAQGRGCIRALLLLWCVL